LTHLLELIFLKLLFGWDHFFFGGQWFIFIHGRAGPADTLTAWLGTTLNKNHSQQQKTKIFDHRAPYQLCP